MSKYSRKQKSQQADQFLDFWQRLYVKAEPYLRAIGITVGTTLLIVFAVWGITSHYEHRAEAATELFGRAVKIYDADLLTEDKAPKPGDEENPIPRYKTDKERADATLAEVAQLEGKAGGADVTRRAVLLRASVLYDQGKYEEAAALFEKFATDSKHPGLAALAREGIGLCHESRGKIDEALAAYKAVEPAKGDFFRDRALYAQARVLRKKGDKAGAVNAYKQLLAKVPASSLKDEVQNQLTVLEATP